MSAPSASTSIARDCAIGGCPREISLVGALLKAGLSGLNMPDEVYKVRLSGPDELSRLVYSLRQGRLAAVSLSGAFCYDGFRLADHADAGAIRCQSADVLINVSGSVLAVHALHDAFVRWLGSLEVSCTTAVVMGSGARACAAVAACKVRGFPVIAVTSRSWTSTEALHERESANRIRDLGGLPMLWPGQNPTVSSRFSREMRLQFTELARSANAIIQTVAVEASTPDAAPLAESVPWAETRRDAVVCDLVYGPESGPYLAGAERRGLSRIGGEEMWTSRAMLLVERWTGQRPCRAAMHAAALRVGSRQKR